jgi:hypothetical protein
MTEKMEMYRPLGAATKRRPEPWGREKLGMWLW